MSVPPQKENTAMVARGGRWPVPRSQSLDFESLLTPLPCRACASHHSSGHTEWMCTPRSTKGLRLILVWTRGPAYPATRAQVGAAEPDPSVFETLAGGSRL